MTMGEPFNTSRVEAIVTIPTVSVSIWADGVEYRSDTVLGAWDALTAGRLELIRAAIDRAQQEILADVESGRVPETVASFSELHDYVDANEYGGLCDNAPPIVWDAGGAIQDAVHRWIVAGGIAEGIVEDDYDRQEW